MNESITSKNACIVAFMFYISNAYMWGKNERVGRDSWMFVLIGMAIYCIVMLLYASICKNAPGKNLFELFHSSFASCIAKLFSIIYILYGFLITYATTLYYTDFIAVNILQRTPRQVILGFICIACVIIACSGRSAMGWWASFFVVPVVFFCLFDIIFSLGNINIDNLMPMLYDKNIIVPGIMSSLVFPLGEIIILFSVFGGVNEKRSYYKMWIIPWICANILISTVYARNVSVLGEPLNNVLAFATYFVQSVASISIELQRVEVIISVIIWFANIVCGGVAMVFTAHGIKQLITKVSGNAIVISVGVTAFVTAMLVPNSADDIIKLIDKLKYVLVSLQIAGPLAISVAQLAKRSGTSLNKTEN